MAERFGLSRRRVSQLVAEVTASGNGHRPEREGMNSKPYDELPWWCQLLWPWFGPPWYEQVEDLDAYLAAYWCALHLPTAELAELLAGDDPPGEGYLAKAGRLTAARHQAREIISYEYGPPASEDEDVDDEDDGPTPDGDRPVVVDRGHSSWAEVDPEQRERIGDSPGEDSRL